MDGSSASQAVKDRSIDPSKVSLSASAERYVHIFLDHISNLERRVRARRAIDQALHLKMVAALALDLAHRELTAPGAWLTVSLQREQYGTKARPAPFLTEKFPDLVKLLAADRGFVDFRLGAQGAFGGGVRSVIRAGSGLRTLIEQSELTLSDIGRNRALRGDVIVLKGQKVAGKARKMLFAETDETRQMREEMQEIDEWLANADLLWAGDEIEDRIDTGDRHLRRIFNDGRFDCGGRLFGGFWQRAKSDDRLDYILFESRPASALDFGQMAVRIAYSMQRATPPSGHDLYDVPGLEGLREGVKRVLNAMLAADSIPQRFPQGSRKYFPSRMSLSEVKDAIECHHSALKPMFGTGQALRIMKVESDLLVAILLRLKRLGVVALPIHDCVLVSEGNEAAAKSVMEDTCKEILGVEGRVEIKRAATTRYTSVAHSSPLKRGA